MKVLRSVTLSPEIIESVQEIADKNYLGNFSMTVQLLLEIAIVWRKKENGNSET